MRFTSKNTRQVYTYTYMRIIRLYREYKAGKGAKRGEEEKKRDKPINCHPRLPRGHLPLLVLLQQPTRVCPLSLPRRLRVVDRNERKEGIYMKDRRRQLLPLASPLSLSSRALLHTYARARDYYEPSVFYRAHT